MKPKNLKLDKTNICSISSKISNAISKCYMHNKYSIVNELKLALKNDTQLPKSLIEKTKNTLERAFHFNSEFNEFVNFAVEGAGAMNIDLVFLKDIYKNQLYPGYKQVFRVVEFKHTNESTTKFQDKVFDKFTNMFSLMNSFDKKVKHELFKIETSYPYDVAFIHDYLTGTNYKLLKLNFFRFISFKYLPESKDINKFNTRHVNDPDGSIKIIN